MKYPGRPVDEMKLAASQWDHVDEKFGKNIVEWKGNMISIRHRVTLVNAFLNSISLYMLSFLEASKCFIKMQACTERGWYGRKLMVKRDII
jgi:hypothetical protein